jgi:ketosteroid isomerase-like protein
MIRSIALALAIPATLVAQDLKKQVEGLHTAMVSAFAASPASVAKFYTDDAGVVGGGFRAVGRTAMDDYWKSIGPGHTWKLEVLDVGGIPEAPWVHGLSTLTNPTGRVSATEFIGLLQRGVDDQLRFRVDAYAGGPAKAQPGDEAAVRKLDSLWASLYAKHDTVSAAQLYAPYLVFVSANGTHKTFAGEMADIRPAAGLVMEYFRTTPTTVKTFDRVAIVSGTADWRFAMNGTPRQVGRPYTAIYTRGGPLGWRIVAVQMGDGRVARGRP